MKKVIALLINETETEKIKMCSIFSNQGNIVAEIYLYTEK